MEAAGACLDLLQQSASAEENTSAINTLIKILRNIQSHPGEEKYKTIKTSNPAFLQKVWRHEGAQQFLLAVGWVELDESIVLIEDNGMKEAISLLETRSGPPVAASRSSPLAVTSPQAAATNTYSSKEMSEKDKKLAEERKYQLERIKQEKAERKRISDKIRADRQETSTREVKESRAQKLPFGSNVKKFENKG